MSHKAVLDANILYPFLLRDMILYAAHFSLFKPIWSKMILNEVERNLILNGIMESHNVSKLLQQMKKIFPDAEGTGFEHLISKMTNDPKDRHIMALAIHEDASMIVTNNIKDFYPLVEGIEVISADDFLCGLLVNHPHEISDIIRIQLSNYRNPPISQKEILEYYKKQVPHFTEKLRILLASDS